MWFVKLLSSFLILSIPNSLIILCSMTRSSGYEVAMCWPQIFGTDVDIFSWDYGMTDGRPLPKFIFYAYRGGIRPSQPTFVGINPAFKDKAILQLGEMGLDTFSFEPKGLGYAVPDSLEKSPEEVEKLPEYIRWFKCGTKIEGGDEACGKRKFTPGCRRSKQTSWHPG